MSVTSANTADLDACGTASGQRAGRLGTSRTAAANKASAVAAGCDFQHPSTPSLAALADLVTSWNTNEQFVKQIHDDLVEANTYDGDGNATVSNAVIAQSLADAGLTDAPGVVDVAAIELYGQPPYSGFVDDPICLANGNFLLHDGDIQLHGLAAAASVFRTYNSLDARGGAFGPGWSSLLDVHLDVQDRLATYRGPDGGGTVFHRDDDGAWVADRRRRLALRPTVDGWVVGEGHERTWTFDADGALVALTVGAAEVAVERTDRSVRFTEHRSGRWVSYDLDPTSGLATGAHTSDGRTATYRHDDQGRLVGAERDRGSVTYEVDEHGFLAAVVDADGIVICRNEYDPSGRVRSQVEHHGRETRYEYRADGVSTVTAADGSPPNVMVHDRRGRMTAMIDGAGATMRVAYDDDDNVVQVVDRTGATTRYQHDERGNVLCRTDPDGLTVRFTWDDRDRLVTQTGRSGHTTRFEYAGDVREPVRIVQPDGSEVVTTFDDAGLPTSVVDADGVTARLTWNRDGLVEALESGVADGALVLRYDDAARTVGLRTAQGTAATLDLDAAGRVRALRTPDGERRYAYSPAGRMVGGHDLAGNHWTYGLDVAGDLSTVTDDRGQLLTLERDLVGQVTATVNADGGRARFEYDPVGRRTASIDPVGNRTEYRYDAEGRSIQVLDAAGRRSSRRLDVLGRSIVEEAPGGARSTRTYHPDGQLATHTDAAGHTWTYDVDAMGRVVAATDPLGATTTYRYTPGGRLAEVRSPLGRALRREYDAAGRLAGIVEPDGTEVTLERRADGAVVNAWRNGVATSYDYDESGRCSAIAGPWGSVAEEREAGLVTGIEGPGGVATRFRHDPRGLLEQVTDPAGVVTSFAHDECGRLLAHTTVASTATFDWDEAGRLRSLTDPYGRRTTLGRDERGNVDEVRLPDGTGATWTFGADGFLDRIADLDGHERVSVVRDARGEIVAVRTPHGELTATQDATGQLTSLGNGAGTVRYTWDADGDLVGLADDAHRTVIERDTDGRVTAFRFDDGPEIAAPGPVDVERDDARRIVTDERGRRHRYDLAGRLASTTVGEATTTYGYDDLGLLATERTPDGVRTYHHGLAGELVRRTDEHGLEVRYAYDEVGRRTAETRSDGGAVAYRWDDFGRLVGVTRTDADGTEHHHEIERDPLGRPERIDATPILWDGAAVRSLVGIGDERYLWSGNQVLVATDPDATWDRRVTDDPWGTDDGEGLRLGYRGELALDDLLFLGDRVYDTRSRSFLSRDPLPSVPGRLTHAGLYSYAWCDPVNLVDPTGHRPLSDDEYAAWKDANTKGFVRQHWKTIAKVGVMVLSVAAIAAATVLIPGVGGMIVAGALIGAAQSGAMTAIDGGSAGDILTSAAIGGAFGALTGGLSRFVPASTASSFGGRLLENGARNAAVEYPVGFAQEGVDTLVTGDPYSVGDALLNGTVGTLGGSLGAEIQFRQTPAPGPAPTGAGGQDPPDVLPSPGNDPSVSGVNPVTQADLEGINGIGPVLSERVMDQRNALGGPLTREQLLEIDGIGPVRADAILNAGLN